MSHKRKTSEKTGESDLSGHADSGEQETGEAPSSIDVEASAASADAAQAAVERYLRLAAEFENYKKRAQKDQVEYVKYANERLLKDLLPVLDNLQRALEHAQQPGSTNGPQRGIAVRPRRSPGCRDGRGQGRARAEHDRGRT